MKRVLLDTNLLLLYLVGICIPTKLDWKRLQAFDLEDFNVLSRKIVNHAHVTLPNVLTEASNHLGSGYQEAFGGASRLLGWYMKTTQEVYVPSTAVVTGRDYAKLGLTDGAIIQRCLMDKVDVWTVDHDLYGTLTSKGVVVHNLRHEKTPKTRRK